VAVTRETFGRLDVLVNNAGYGDISPIEDTSLDEFRAQIETNLFGVINVTKAALPLMREQGAGHILQFSSVGGRIGPVGRSLCSRKVGRRRLLRSALQRGWATRG
jgi:NAD(P)-dependent dehydrogenase (short-subunit alcohol dehydrogenase family)